MGLAISQLLAYRGATLSLADITAQAVETAAQSLTVNDQEHMYCVVDVRDSSSVDRWIEYTVQKYGRLDGAVRRLQRHMPAATSGNSFRVLGQHGWHHQSSQACN